jgi:hypothetical protein
MSNIDNIISLLNHFTSFEDSSELGEQDAAPATAPSTGGGGGGKPAYPTVTKWESGVTRGPANQIGLTKWADIVKINRGKANTLL